MKTKPFQVLRKLVSLTSVVVALSLWPALPASAQGASASAPAVVQGSLEVYAATAIASGGYTGNIAGRMTIRVGSYTTSAEKTSLVEAFEKNPQDGMALLQTMSKGYVNIEGRPGRKIYAVFSCGVTSWRPRESRKGAARRDSCP